MKSIALPIGLIALAGTIVPPVLVLTGLMAPDPMKTTMLVSCIVWFVTAPMWMRSE
ncbi:MAG: hypothetical protein J0M04_05120 [Verrucomicrobia bacterium]|nr:hypothetical protein [Verrucomicrobiota bacterium]